jgi:hypothetical protein
MLNELQFMTHYIGEGYNVRISGVHKMYLLHCGLNDKV